MGIELGLSRIRLLLKKLGDPHLSTWHAIHIAGTNGKGSICSYLSSILTHSHISNGKFTSPHLVSVNDSITLNGRPVLLEQFDTVKQKVIQFDRQFKINATEFEILTAVAFEIFRLEKVKFAIVEVGLGGRLDSTNVIPSAFEIASQNTSSSTSNHGVLVTGISKISMDHENILGSTIEAIAKEKAGIIKPLVPCVVDGSNEPSVLQVVQEVSNANKSDLSVVNKFHNEVDDNHFTLLPGFQNAKIDLSKSPLQGQYQRNNLSVALKIIDILKTKLIELNHYKSAQSITLQSIENGIAGTKWPGRLQKLKFKYNSNDPFSLLPILLDGAHNHSAALELQKFINSQIKKGLLKKNIVFVMSITSSKDFLSLLKPLLNDGLSQRNENNEYGTNFSLFLTNFDYKKGVDGMPWIKSYDCQVLKLRILEEFGGIVSSQQILVQPNVEKLLSEDLPAFIRNEECSVVACGSLYLVGEILRIHLGNNGSVNEIY